MVEMSGMSDAFMIYCPLPVAMSERYESEMHLLSFCQII